MGVIKQLKKLFSNENIFPITKSNAVYDDDLGRMDTSLKSDFAYMTNEDVEETTEVRDSDTVGGHAPEYFVSEEKLADMTKFRPSTTTVSSDGSTITSIYGSELYKDVISISEDVHGDTQITESNYENGALVSKFVTTISESGSEEIIVSETEESVNV